MATKRRQNGAGRWTVALASVLTAAGFWFGVINGPQPAQANVPDTAVAQASSTAVQATPTPPRVQANAPSRIAAPRVPLPQLSVTPRLRTRGS